MDLNSNNLDPTHALLDINFKYSCLAKLCYLFNVLLELLMGSLIV